MSPKIGEASEGGRRMGIQWHHAGASVENAWEVRRIEGRETIR